MLNLMRPYTAPDSSRPAYRPLLIGLLMLAGTLGVGCQSTEPAARDYFFSPRGNDNANGGFFDPYRSIDKANTLRLNPGDRLLFEGGQEFVGNLKLDHHDAGTTDKPVVIGSWGWGRATVRAGRGTGIHIANAGGIKVQELVVTGAGVGGNAGNGIEFVNTLRGGQRLGSVVIDKVDVSGFGGEGILVHGNPIDESPSGFDGVQITDCTATGNLHTGILVAGNMAFSRRAGATLYSHRKVQILRCRAADNPGDPTARRLNRSGSGILLAGADGGLIEACEAFNNGGASQGLEGGPIGIWTTASTEVIIRKCKSHHNRTAGQHDGGGFCLDGGVTKSVLEDNESENNDGSGYGLYQYATAPPAGQNVVRRNVSRNDGRKNGYAGIHIWDDGGTLRDVKITDNTVELSAGAPARDPSRALWLQSPTTGVRITRNKFTAGEGVRVVDVAAGQRDLRLAGNSYPHTGSRLTPTVVWEGQFFPSAAVWMASLHSPGKADVPTADAR